MMPKQRHFDQYTLEHLGHKMPLAPPMRSFRTLGRQPGMVDREASRRTAGTRHITHNRAATPSPKKSMPDSEESKML